MSERLTKEDRKTLRCLLKNGSGLLWGGVYERGGDPDLIRLQHSGLIEAVAQPYRAGRLTFPGGYRITTTGEAALALREECT